MTMNADQVFKLLDAGFSKDEIMSIMNPQDASTAVKTETHEVKAQEGSEGSTVTPEVKAQEGSEAPKEDATAKALADLTNQVNALVKAQQASNRAGTGNVQKLYETTDDILAGIINPKF